MNWPVMRWSPDEKYLARVTIGQSVSVYDVPGMGLLDKKSIKLEGVKDFAWRPSTRSFDSGEEDEAKKPWENMLAYWTPDIQNQPARVTVMAIPSRNVVRSKNLFNVSDCQLFWQSSGDFLCVKVDRHTKTKKSTFCNLEIFRIRENDCPVQTLEIKDTVIQFAWEPKGDRFVLIHSSDPNATTAAPGVLPKTSVSFYGFDNKKGDFRLLKTYDGKTANLPYWSPKGRHVILSTLGSSSKYDLEFWDLDLNNEGKPEGSRDPAAGIQLIKAFEHYGMT
ncbi:dipeptidyl peptidase IV/CD26, N-terminal domain-containing protein, partial [Atractiella rhizophila]